MAGSQAAARAAGKASALALIAFLAARAQPSDSAMGLPEAQATFQPTVILDAGYAFSGTPQLGAHCEFKRGWQLGLELRSWARKAEASQDYWPEIGLQVRRLWLAAEENDALRNSEYVEIGLGLFPAYSFGKTDFSQSFEATVDALGYRPMARLAIGKYWKPFNNVPGGLDANLVLGRYLSGHPPGFGHRDLLTVFLGAFWELGWKSDGAAL